MAHRQSDQELQQLGDKAWQLLASFNKQALLELIREKQRDAGCIRAVIDYRDRNSGQTLLMRAAATAQDEVVSQLLKNGAKADALNVLEHSHGTALHEATAQRNHKIAELLLSYGANAFQGNASGITPMDLAVSTKQLDLVEKYASRSLLRIDVEFKVDPQPLSPKAQPPGTTDWRAFHVVLSQYQPPPLVAAAPEQKSQMVLFVFEKLQRPATDCQLKAKIWVEDVPSGAFPSGECLLKLKAPIDAACGLAIRRQDDSMYITVRPHGTGRGEKSNFEQFLGRCRSALHTRPSSGGFVPQGGNAARLGLNPVMEPLRAQSSTMDIAEFPSYSSRSQLEASPTNVSGITEPQPWLAMSGMSEPQPRLHSNVVYGTMVSSRNSMNLAGDPIPENSTPGMADTLDFAELPSYGSRPPLDLGSMDPGSITEPHSGWLRPSPSGGMGGSKSSYGSAGTYLPGQGSFQGIASHLVLRSAGSSAILEQRPPIQDQKAASAPVLPAVQQSLGAGARAAAEVAQVQALSPSTSLSQGMRGLSLSPPLNLDIPPEQVQLLDNQATGNRGLDEPSKGKYQGKDVSIKLLQAEDEVALRARLEAVAGLRHPNVMRLTGASLSSAQQRMLLMEPVANTLANIVFPGKDGMVAQLPLLRVFQLAMNVFSGLEYLHSQGIALCGVQPSTVMIDTVGTAKLSGLEQAHRVPKVPVAEPASGKPTGSTQDAEPWSGERQGAESSPYEAPECSSSAYGKVTAAADVFSAAVILYEMLLSDRPWQGVKGPSIVFKVVFDSGPPSISRRCCSELREMLLRCFLLNPEARPTASDVLTTLRSLRPWAENAEYVPAARPSAPVPSRENGLLGAHPQYKFISRLSTGKQSVVDLFQEKSTNDFVAIRFVQRSRLLADPKLRFQMEHEVLNHRWLKHPHIVQFRELFLTDQYVCIVMEHADAGTLQNEIRSRARLPESLARWFFQQLLIALDYCHRPGQAVSTVQKPAIFLRNIKLESVLLSRRPGFQVPFVKLSTFNCTEDAERHPGSEEGEGNPCMAPEVLQAAEPERSASGGPKADAWSCGVILYAMLTGRYPFASLKHALAAQWELPSEVEQSVSPPCRDLLSRLLAADPAQRLGISEALNHPWSQQDLPPGAATMTAQMLATASDADVQGVDAIKGLLRQASAGSAPSQASPFASRSQRPIINLKDLALAVAALPPSAVLDLGGQELSGHLDDHLSLQLNRCTLCNVTLVLPAGRQLILRSPKQDAQAPNAIATLEGVHIHGLDAAAAPSSRGPSALVHVAGGSVRMRGCTVAHASEVDCALVLVSDGASLELLDGCALHDAKCGDGLVVRGAGSSVRASNLNARFVAGSCVSVMGGASADLSGSQLRHSSHGLLVAGDSSRASAHKCELSSCQLANMAVTEGGSLKVTDCQVHRSQTTGLWVRGQGASAVAERCQVSGNSDFNISVQAGGAVHLSDCDVHSSSRGCGLWVQGASSQALVFGCRVHDNRFCNVQVQGAWNVQLSDCQLERSKAACGLRVHGQGSSVVVERCEVSGNHHCNVYVEEGAAAQLESCQLRRCVEGAGLLVSGNGTKAVAAGCILDGNKLSNVVAERGGWLELSKCEASNSQAGYGLEVKRRSAASASECTFSGNAKGDRCDQHGTVSAAALAAGKRVKQADVLQ